MRVKDVDVVFTDDACDCVGASQIGGVAQREFVPMKPALIEQSAKRTRSTNGKMNFVLAFSERARQIADVQFTATRRIG